MSAVLEGYSLYCVCEGEGGEEGEKWYIVLGYYLYCVCSGGGREEGRGRGTPITTFSL